jgi:small neutral amino acid transporter SnatA (MarC family)
LVLAVFLDLGQFLIFECSSLPGLSLLFGLFAFAPIYLIPVGVSVMRRKRWHGETRLSIALSISALILLLSLVCLGGLILTHLCP